MRLYSYKLLLALLERFQKLAQQLSPAFRHVASAYRRIYKVRLFQLRLAIFRKYNTGTVTPDTLFDFLGKRGTLQAVLFIIAVIAMVPHSKLYTKETFGLPGKETLLYKLAPSNEFDLVVEEVSGGTMVQEVLAAEHGWKEGAVSAGSGNLAVEEFSVPTQVIGFSAGGTAIAKNTVFGTDFTAAEEAGGVRAKTRTAIVTHTVEGGDTISTIATKFGLKAETILWANGLTEKSLIKPGQELKILPMDGVYHKVGRGDTVLAIAQRYRVESDAILSANNLDEPLIKIGDELMIPGAKPLVSPNALASGVSKVKNAIVGKLVTPPPSVVATGGYVWPTAARIITQYFGWRHTGLDIAGKMGTPIYAARGGTVVRAQTGWNGGYGNVIVIDHGDGLQTLYGHSSQLFVSTGDAVKAGQTISLMGSTGRSTGPHVHFEVRLNGTFQNPLRYVK